MTATAQLAPPVQDEPPFKLGPQVELLEDDGEPLETLWHRYSIGLLIEVLQYLYRARDDFFCGGNCFVYFSEEQARNRDYRGPDFFFVEGVPRQKERKFWCTWYEDGRYPDVIIELASPTTVKIDRTVKKAIYEKTFHTYEYFIYDPETQKLDGWRLIEGVYEPITPDESSRLFCKKLGLWLGTWRGKYLGDDTVWLRWFDDQGQVVPTEGEAEHTRADMEHQRAETAHQRAETAHQMAEAARQMAEAERQRAEAERQRAEALQAELDRLKARLPESGPS